MKEVTWFLKNHDIPCNEICQDAFLKDDFIIMIGKDFTRGINRRILDSFKIDIIQELDPDYDIEENDGDILKEEEK